MRKPEKTYHIISFYIIYTKSFLTYTLTPGLSEHGLKTDIETYSIVYKKSEYRELNFTLLTIIINASCYCNKRVS